MELKVRKLCAAGFMFASQNQYYSQIRFLILKWFEMNPINSEEVSVLFCVKLSLNSRSELGINFSVFHNDLEMYALLLCLVLHLFHKTQSRKITFTCRFLLHKTDAK